MGDRALFEEACRRHTAECPLDGKTLRSGPDWKVVDPYRRAACPYAVVVTGPPDYPERIDWSMAIAMWLHAHVGEPILKGGAGHTVSWNPGGWDGPFDGVKKSEIRQNVHLGVKTTPRHEYRFLDQNDAIAFKMRWV